MASEVHARRSPSASPSLDELSLARAQRGDRAAFRRLVEVHQGQVQALLARMLVGRSAEVEDLAQETFLRVHQALPGFDPAGSAKLSTWILTIATRLAIDLLRRPQRAAPEPAIAGPDPESEVAGRVLEQRLLRAMAELPDDARAVLILRAYHDLDYPEIAQALNLELGTVKSRLSRARAALQQVLERER
jgi:RNA polymerase sigma-70 factor (ECF subfamily)